MNLELTEHEGRLLSAQLERHIDELEKEAARTDRHDLQHALAVDVDALRALHERLRRSLAPEGRAALGRVPASIKGT